jgi:L-threonylcarbamoyladenylate synthase
MNEQNEQGTVPQEPEARVVAVATPAAVPAEKHRPAVPADADGIAQAAQLLMNGGVVAFPTETVYGLGADAANPDAIVRIFKIKKRPQNHPLIVHIPDASHLERWAVDIPDTARRLVARYWPGPLTLVLRRAEGVPDLLTGGQDTIALRVAAHPVAEALLKAMLENDDGTRRIGIAAPSANRFGRISPTTAAHVIADLGNDADIVLDGGACDVGIESSIIDFSRGEPVMLRPGRISAQDVAALIGIEPSAADADAPRVSGSLEAHYAPRAKLRLMKRTAMIDALSAHKGQRVAALALEVNVPRLAPGLVIVVPAVASRYAQSLYANLRVLDAAGADLILVETPPSSPAWAGVHDRLSRAAAAHPDKPAKAPKPEAADAVEVAVEGDPPLATAVESEPAQVSGQSQ